MNLAVMDHYLQYLQETRKGIYNIHTPPLFILKELFTRNFLYLPPINLITSPHISPPY